MEHWLVTNWWQLGILGVILVSSYVQVNNSKKKLDEHCDTKNPAPHPNCLIHSATLADIRDSVKRIEDHIISSKNGI